MQEFDQRVAARKAEEMNKKNQEFRALFGTPEDEVVIQDYKCNVKGGMGGRLYISANYICYASSLSSYQVSVPSCFCFTIDLLWFVGVVAALVSWSLFCDE